MKWAVNPCPCALRTSWEGSWVPHPHPVPRTVSRLREAGPARPRPPFPEVLAQQGLVTFWEKPAGCGLLRAQPLDWPSQAAGQDNTLPVTAHSAHFQSPCLPHTPKCTPIGQGGSLLTPHLRWETLERPRPHHLPPQANLSAGVGGWCWRHGSEEGPRRRVHVDG